MRTTLTIALIAALAGCAGNQYEPVEMSDFASYDIDNDGFVDAYEWEDTYEDMNPHASWDMNDDGYIYRETGSYEPWGVWDANDDDYLDDDEFADALFATWDVDDNERLDSDEFELGVEAF